ncbi:MAG: flagellar motor protein MotB [Proteobacteria bacterium]|nr:flagellar motor protein MotB [Pseudomonadota bacterium]MBU4296589.1 flagellar motor protein MotB [Pseudomonadota bacterium]MCG2748218.1 flagellar motor protein MotB [Desulfobulbaceae bacterium]
MTEQPGQPDTPQENNTSRLEETVSDAPGQNQAQGSVRPLKVIRHKKARGRRVAAFQQEMQWESGMRVYDETSFARMRMPRSPHWSVVWSDLMMTMFILFAVLYIYQLANREVLFEKIPSPDIASEARMTDRGPVEPFSETADNRLARIYDLSRLVVDSDSMRDIVRVDLAPDKTVRIILTGDLLFDSGSAEIKGSAMQAMKKIIPLVAQTPYMINVVGHTDDLPIQTPEFPSNWELSLVRASRVARFLMQETHLDENRFYVTGHASTQPVAANDTQEHRAANRRVEIILTKEQPAAVAAEGEP